MVDKKVLLNLIQRYGEQCRIQGALETLNDLHTDPYKRGGKARQDSDNLYDHIVLYIETGDPNAAQVI